jgi:hypothetical protein
MENPAKIETVMAMTKPFLHIKKTDFKSLRNLLDQVCSEVAQRFTLYGSNGKPRKAAIIDALAKSSCLSCITRKLSNRARSLQDNAILV